MNLNNKQNLFSIVMRGVRLLLAVIIMSPTSVFANPYGGDVVAGLANIGGSGSVVTVNQLTDRAIINWNGFSIDTGELTKFIQPNALSAILNRVTGGDPSAIYGTIQANGQVFLINPNGITVGAGGVINAQSFIASTLDVVVGQFMAGGDLLFSGSSLASVKNAGKINALGGDVMLIAHNLVNTGEINAANGTAAMAAGSEVLLKSAGNERVFVQAGNGTADVGVDQKGQILAAAAELKAAGGNVYGLAINNEGVVRAEGVENRDGRVYLTASGGTVVNAGEISAKQGDKGGEVRIAADNIVLKNGSLIDVSGQNGGGTALIGGDIHGTNPDMPNAKNTTVEAGAVIKADAIESGNGGKVIVWSDDTTNFQGNISAVGGAISGNGGFAEVSGKATLVYDGLADLRAPNGETGTLLLDPFNLTISAAASSALTEAPDYTWTGTATSNLNVTILTNQLGGSNVLVQTSGDGGDIIVASAISWNSAYGLTLTASQNIYVNTAITNSGTGSLTLNAASGAGTINLSANITTTGGAQLYNGAVVLSQSEILASNNGNITFNKTIDGSDAFKSLTLSAGSGSVYLYGSVGAGTGTSLTNFTVSGTGTTYLSGATGVMQVKTSGSQLYNNSAVSINTNNAELISTNQLISFAGTVDSPSYKALTTQSYGDTTFSGAIGTTKVLDALNVTILGTGNINLNGGAIHTINAQGYAGPVLIAANDAYLYTVNGDISFGYSVGSPITIDSFTHKHLTAEVGIAGNVIFSNTVGAGDNTLSSLIAKSGASVDDKIYINGTSVTTDGSQEYDGNVSIGFHDAFLTSNNDAITFQHMIDASGGYGLTTSSDHDTVFGGAIGSGATGKLGFLNATVVDTSNHIHLNGNVRTLGSVSESGNQRYNGDVLVDANSALTAEDGVATSLVGLGAITFVKKVDGANTLTTTSDGSTTFTQAVGSDSGGELAALTANIAASGAGKININGGSVETAGNSTYADEGSNDDGDQYYDGDVVLGYDTTFTAVAYAGDTDGGAVTFAHKVDGAAANTQALTVNTSGLTTFTQAVGTTALKSLETDQYGTTLISGGSVNTYGAQTYNDDVTLGANAILTAGTPGVIFKKTVNNAISEGTHASLKVDGKAEFDGIVGTTADTRLSTLEVTGTSTLGALTAISINTASTQLYTGRVTLGNNVTLDSTGAEALGNITFTSTINGAHNLIVNTAGITKFNDAVFASNVTTDAAGGSSGGTTEIHSNVTTTGGTQTYGDAVKLDDNIVLTGTTVIFKSTLDSLVSTEYRSLKVDGNAEFDGVVGTASDSNYRLATLWITGTSLLKGTAINTTSTQDYDGAVTLETAALNTLTGTIVTFGSTVDASSAGHGLKVSGDAMFKGTVGTASGSDNRLSTLETTGNTTLGLVTSESAISVNTTGNQTYGDATSDAVTLGANTTLASGAAILFNGRVDSSKLNENTSDGHTLTTGSTGVTTFSGMVGASGSTELGSLAATATTINVNGGFVATSGNQAYTGAVVLGAATAFTAQAGSGGNIVFNNTVDSSSNGKNLLTTNSIGNTTFGGAVGGAVGGELGSLNATASGTGSVININGSSVETLGSASARGSQYYQSNVVLGADATLTAADGTYATPGTDAGEIRFMQKVDGAYKLTTTSDGNTTFTQAVGYNTELAALTANITGASTGKILLNGGTIETLGTATGTGSQIYDGDVVLGYDTTLTADDGAYTPGATAGAINFVQTVNGAYNLIVNTSGLTTFGGKVGDSAALTSLTTDAGGSTAINSSRDIATAAIITTGAQTYNDDVVLGINAILNTSSGVVYFKKTLNSSTVNTLYKSLKVNGNAEFDGIVGTSNSSDYRLSTLEVTGNTTFGDRTNSADISVNTTDNQTYGNSASADAVTLGADTTLASGGAIVFNSTVDSSRNGSTISDVHTLTTGSTGVTTFTGAVGNAGTSQLGSLNATATTIDINGGAVKTGLLGSAATGSQLYNGNVVLGYDTTLTAVDHDATVGHDGGNITFDHLVDAAAVGSQSLTVDALTGDVTFTGAVGTTALNILDIDNGAVVNAGKIYIDGGAVTTTAFQYYHQAVELGASGLTTTLTSTSGSGEINFISTVNGSVAGTQNLIVNTSDITTFGGLVGNTAALASLTTNAVGSTIMSGGTTGSGETLKVSVNTTGAQTYNDAVTLGANSILTAGGTGVVFKNTLNSYTQETYKSLKVNGNAEFDGDVGAKSGADYKLGALEVTGNTILGLSSSESNISVNTNNGSQTYGDNAAYDTVTLGANTTLTSTNSGAIVFNSTVDSSKTGAGTDPVVYTSDGHTLITNSGSNATTFNGAVGAAGNSQLGSLNASASVININGSAITTTGAQHYNQAVVLGGTTTDNATTLTSTANGEIHFVSTVNGAKNLIVVSGGIKIFGGAVGATTPLASLYVDDLVGTIQINGGSVRTTGAQTYKDAVTLGASEGLGYTTTLTSLGVVADEVTTYGDIHFYSTINGTGQNLIVNTGGLINASGVTTFAGLVGNTAALASLVTNAGGSTAINGGSSEGAITIKTTGLQTYNDAVILGDDTTLTSTGSGAITLASTVNGLIDGTHVDNTNNHDLTVTTGGMTTFGGTVGAIKKLDDITVTGTSTLGVGSAIAINTSGTQTYTGPVTLAQNATLDSIGVEALGNITFTSTINGAHNLIVNTAGITKFGDVVSLANLTTDATDGSHGGSTELYGNVTTTAVQTYGDAVKLAKSEGLTTLTGTNVIFKSTLDSLTGNKSLLVAGNAEFDDVVGNTALSTLQIIGTSFLNGGAVTTTSTQYYDGAVTLGKATLLNTTNSAVTFTGTSATINGAHTLNIQAGNGPVTLGGAVGAGESGVLTSLTIGTALDGGHTHINGGAVKALTQTYNNATELGVNTTLTGNAAFKNTLNSFDGNHSLTVTGNAEFDGIVGTASDSANRLSTFGVTGNTIIGLASVDAISVYTTGTQTYGNEVTDAVTLAANTTLASGDAITFNGTVDSSWHTGEPGASDGHTLTTDSDGSTTFGGAVGHGTYGKLGFLTVEASNIYLNGATVNTVATSGGNQTYNGAVTLGHDVTLSAGGAILFDGTVDSAVNSGASYGYDLATYSVGDITFQHAVGGGTNGQLGSLSVNANYVTNVVWMPAVESTAKIHLDGGAITTLGTQDYFGAVELGAATTLTATDTGITGHIDFDLTVDGAYALTLNAGYDVDFDASVGSLTPLTSLSVTTGAGYIRFDGIDDGTYMHMPKTVDTVIKTTGAQNYDGNVMLLSNNFSLTSSAGAIAFMHTIGGTYKLTTTSVGNTTFTDAVSLASLNVTATTGDIRLNGATIDTLGTSADVGDGSQSYTGHVVLTDNVALTAAVGTHASPTATDGAIFFTSTVDSSGDTAASDGHTLTTGSAGATTFNGAVGGGTYGELGSLSATASVINLNGLTVETKGTATATGNQVYAGDVVLQKATTLTAVDGAHATGAAAGAITFNGKVDGAFALVTTSDGDTTITHAVGYDTDGELTALTVNISADGMTNLRTINLNGGTIEAAAQYYNGDVELGANTFLTGTSLSLNAAKYFDGNGYDLTLTFGSGVTIPTLATVFANVKNFTSNGSGGTTINARTFTTTGTQTYGNAVILGGNATLVSTGEGTLGNIGFASTVNGVYTLTVNTGGITTFGGAVGNTGILASLTTNAAGSTAINGGSIHTSGAQTYNDAVTLDGNTVLTTASNVIFKSTLNDASAGYDNASLQVAGNAEFDGIVGTDNTSGNRLSTLEVTGTTTFGYLTSIAVNTTGNQTYTGAVTLNRDALLNTSAGGITFGGTVASLNDNGHDLITYSHGDTVFNGNIGAVGYELGNLTAEIDSIGEGHIYLNGTGGVMNIRTDNDQEYIGQVYLGGNATLTASVGSIMFDGAVDSVGATPYDLTTHSFLDTSFNGNVGHEYELYNLMAEITSTGVNAGRIHLSGTAGTISVETSGNQEYDGNVHLGGNAALTSTERAITFDGTVNSYNHYDLTTNSDRDTTFWGAVGDSYTLGDLSVTTGETAGVGHTTGLIVLRGANITTNGDQDYNGGVILGADTVMTANAPLVNLVGYPYGTPSASTGEITFLKTVDSEWNNYHTLTTVSAGDTTFSDLVGDAETTTLGVSYFGVLGALSVTAHDYINLDTVSVETTGAQSYSGDVVLGYYDTTLTTDDSDIVFAGTLNGFQDLTLATGTGDITLDKVGDTESLQSLTMNHETGSGILTLNGDITSWGVQDYERDVIIGNDITLDSTIDNSQLYKAPGYSVSGYDSDIADGDIHFHGTVDGDGGIHSGLTLISGIGDVYLDGMVGDDTDLTSLTIEGTGTTYLSGGCVHTIGDQTYNQAVQLYDDTYFSSSIGDISFASTLNGLHVPTAPGFTPQVADAAYWVYLDANHGDITLDGAVDAKEIDLYGNTITWNADLNATGYVDIEGTDLVMNGDINSSGADETWMNSTVLMVADGTFKNAASHTINLASGSRFLIYSVNPALDTRGGLEGSTQYSTDWWQDPSFTGSGFLYTVALDVPEIVDEQSFQATNTYATFDVPEPGAGTHGGGFFSVINTPTNTNVYKREHRRAPANDQQQDDAKKKKDEARASVNKNSVSRAGGRLGPAFASLPGFSADAGVHSLLRSN